MEVDETYIGRYGRGCPEGRSTKTKTAVFTLVERNGRARSMVTERVNAVTLLARIKENVAADATLMTDKYSAYRRMGLHYKHKQVDHGRKEYARGDVHVNMAEGYFALIAGQEKLTTLIALAKRTLGRPSNHPQENENAQANNENPPLLPR